ncbi:MAG: T9SS type A sorting domain-containing protein [Bacteroidetes bacterium]|nr:T9SS type A sorting domain-containing protein [Bacteroidota bacterium]
MKTISFLVCTALCLISVSSVSSQWQRTNGPAGATVSDIIKNGQNIAIVTVYGEAYFSVDNGSSWTEKPGLPPSFAPRLAYTGNRLYAATQQGVFVTSDSVQTWTQLTSGLGGVYVRGITVKDGIVYIASDESPNDKIYRFSEANQTWENTGSISLNFQFSISNIFALNGFLYTAYSLSIQSGNQVVFRSTDGGFTWLDRSTGLPDGVFKISSVNGILYAGTTNGVYRSQDSGNSWTFSGLAGQRVQAFTNSGDTLFAGTEGFGVYRSVNSGLLWEPFGLFDKWIFDLEINAGNLFAGTNFVGMFRSSVNVNNWQPENNGLNGMPVNSFAFMNNSIIAAAYGGMFVTDDMGATWTDIGKSFIPTDSSTSLRGSHLVYDVAADTSNGILYAGSIYAVYKSTDNGSSWSISGQQIIGGGRVEALFVSYSEPQPKLFAGKGTGVDFAGIFSTQNSGFTWKRDSLGIRYRYMQDIKIKDNFLFAGAGYSVNGGVFRSSDNGNSWQFINNGLPSDFGVQAICVTSQGNILAASDQGLYKSTNNGDSWSFIWNNQDVNGLTTDNSGRIYAASGSPSYPGLYRSSDEGITWSAFNEGLPASTEIAFSVTYKNGFLFSGVDRLGVWKRQVDNPSSVSVTGINVPDNFDLNQNYPNPFNPSTTIEFSVPERSDISINVFDVTGRSYMTGIKNQNLGPGNYKIIFNGGSLSSGIYFYSLVVNGNSIKSKSMLLVK